MTMQTNINITGRRKHPPRKTPFKRYEFNHPFNPFRISDRKKKERILPPETIEFNDGVITCFEKLLYAIQRIIMTPEQKKLNQLAALFSELDRALYTFSTVPCTANINTAIFEHLNYLLKLFCEWQDYAFFFQKMEEDTGPFLRQISTNQSIPLDELVAKIQYLRHFFEKATVEIEVEIKAILEQIQQEHQKNFPDTPYNKNW